MKPRQPAPNAFGATRCQFQPRQYRGKMRSVRTFCQPLLAMSRGFFVFEIALAVGLVTVIENEKPRTRMRTNTPKN